MRLALGLPVATPGGMSLSPPPYEAVALLAELRARASFEDVGEWVAARLPALLTATAGALPHPLPGNARVTRFRFQDAAWVRTVPRSVATSAALTERPNEQGRVPFLGWHCVVEVQTCGSLWWEDSHLLATGMIPVAAFGVRPRRLGVLLRAADWVHLAVMERLRS